MTNNAALLECEIVSGKTWLAHDLAFKDSDFRAAVELLTQNKAGSSVGNISFPW